MPIEAKRNANAGGAAAAALVAGDVDALAARAAAATITHTVKMSGADGRVRALRLSRAVLWVAAN